MTKTIGLGVSVLILPYRPALATAKWIASVQELSNGRLTLGAGVGWMPAEFTAVDVDRRQRGKITDDTLAFFHQAFLQDEVTSNGQKFLFLPRPARPQFLIGGAAPHALNRAIQFGDGWMPTAADPAEMKDEIQFLQDGFDAAGKGAPETIMLKALPLDNLDKAAELLVQYAEIGVTDIDHPGAYENANEFAEICEKLMAVKKLANL